jgi:hypothetical protein
LRTDKLTKTVTKQGLAMKIHHFVAILLALFVAVSCQEHNQNGRTKAVINDYLEAIWQSNFDKAEQYIWTPDGTFETIDSLKYNQMVLDNRQSMRRQKGYLNRNYSQKPTINVAVVSENTVNLLGKKSKTGILICTVELDKKDTCIFMIYNGLNATKAKIGQVIFKNRQADSLDIRTH